MEPGKAEVRPISGTDADAVSRFLHTHLNPRVSVDAWNAILAPPWNGEAPNHGFQLVVDSDIVGAYVAVYSEREVDGVPRRFCNLAAFCVREDHRAQSFRLVRAILAQRDFEFTDFSPSGNVVALNRRLGFQELDTATRVVPNLPRLPHRGLTVTDDVAVIDGILSGRDAQVFRDHRDAPAARHIVATAGGAYCYLVVRRDRRKRLPLFATPLYAGGSTELLRSSWPHLASHLLLRQGALATLAERRILGFDVPHGYALRTPRAKMLLSKAVAPEAVDYLYSELTLLEW
ncbi:hypothetical protein [Mycetocola sp. 2940]|uniref:hypothetical protein n=1 Tax=Mycetocola sp. 2940 TaxID=3156452 RepID=UPI003392D0EB